MNAFLRVRRFIEEVIRRLIPYKNIEQVERIETPVSTEMTTALDTWYQLYLNKADWLQAPGVKSMNLPAFVSSEIARQIVLELKCTITGKGKNGTGRTQTGETVTNPRAEYLKAEFEKLLSVLRVKLEQGCAAGGMVIKPYPNTADGHIYFDWTMDWALYPLAFDDDGNLADVVIPDSFTEGKKVFTRLERHTAVGRDVRITQRAFQSNNVHSLGTEIALSEVPRWASLQPEVVVKDTDGPLFGWYKVTSANNVDVDSPLGASVYSKAVDVIREADLQYSRLLWEYEGSELAIDVDPTVLRPKTQKEGGRTLTEMPKLNERLFRGVDLGEDSTYKVFAPPIRDASLLNGLNQLLIRVEDLCGLSRGTLSDANVDARTATELRIVKQRSYATVADNQRALEGCLKNVIRVMDKYATMYHLAPEGEYEVSFDWDDSIVTDSQQQMNEMLLLYNAQIISKQEFREWYFKETAAQAKAAIAAQQQERMESLEGLLPDLDQGIPAP
jgi:A118 family predicted phage portal protein